MGVGDGAWVMVGAAFDFDGVTALHILCHGLIVPKLRLGLEDEKKFVLPQSAVWHIPRHSRSKHW